MTTSVDFEALQAQQGPKVTLIPYSFVGAGITGDAFSDFSDFSSVIVTANVQLTSITQPSPSLTVTIEESDDGNSWSTTGTPFSFSYDGKQQQTIISPKAYLRAVVASIRGVWQVIEITAVPPYFDAAAMSGGASMCLTFSGSVDIHSATTYSLEWDTLVDNLYDYNALDAIPDGMGVSAIFNGTASDITFDANGTWAYQFVVTLQTGADATLKGYLKTPVDASIANFGPVLSTQANSVSVSGIVTTGTNPQVGVAQIAVTAGAAGNPYNVVPSLVLTRLA